MLRIPVLGRYHCSHQTPTGYLYGSFPVATGGDHSRDICQLKKPAQKLLERTNLELHVSLVQPEMVLRLMFRIGYS
jgi:hypothetical protein